MPDVPPDLAEKVVAADLRNHVKRVGDGANLSPADRQTFIAFAAGEDPEVMTKTRVSHLLKKWLFGGRLSREERAEIDAFVPKVRPKVTTEDYRHGADGYEQFGIRRRTYFRWIKAGKEVTEGPDLPPFDQPGEIEAWYERMRHRGVFTHKFPKEIRAAINQSGATPADAPSPAPSDATTTAATSIPQGDQGSVPESFKGSHNAALKGMAIEVEDYENRLASVRMARDQAYATNQRNEGDMLDSRYREMFDQFTVAKKRALDTMEKERLLIPRAEVEAYLAERVTSIVIGGSFLYQRIAPRLDAVPDYAAKSRVWREAWVEHCAPLMRGQFVPDCLRAVPGGLWQECIDFVLSKAPPPLALDQ